MALFKTEGKRRGRARFVAAALQKASICTPKLGYMTSLTAVLRGSPAGLRRARAFTRRQYGWGISRRAHACARPVFSSPKKLHGLSPSSENGIVSVCFRCCRQRHPML